MSLFKSREWWATQCGSGEEFDRGSLCIANIDNAAEPSLKVITGSFSGLLRIFNPRKRDFKVEDLLLEHNLNLPILQIEAGRFIPNSSELGMNADAPPPFIPVWIAFSHCFTV
jgi:Bardet-Biedl syndrome 9 protein